MKEHEIIKILENKKYTLQQMQEVYFAGMLADTKKIISETDKPTKKYNASFIETMKRSYLKQD